MQTHFKVSEIFYSIQGEGYNTGTPMIFVRFSGCNLDCSFCDTDHSEKEVYTLEGLVNKISLMVEDTDCTNILFTGGEPTLQLFTKNGNLLLEKLYKLGYDLYLETNGSVSGGFGAVIWLKWITVSPKLDTIKICRYDEIKLVVSPETKKLIDIYLENGLVNKYLQPDENKNIDEVVNLVKKYPNVWKLSLQTHKFIGVR